MDPTSGSSRAILAKRETGKLNCTNVSLHPLHPTCEKCNPSNVTSGYSREGLQTQAFSRQRESAPPIIESRHICPHLYRASKGPHPLVAPPRQVNGVIKRHSDRQRNRPAIRGQGVRTRGPFLARSRHAATQ